MIYKNVISVKDSAQLLPIYHDSGLLWRKDRFAILSGTITIKIHHPIQKNLTQEAFMELLEEKINSPV